VGEPESANASIKARATFMVITVKLSQKREQVCVAGAWTNSDSVDAVSASLVVFRVPAAESSQQLRLVKGHAMPVLGTVQPLDLHQPGASL